MSQRTHCLKRIGENIKKYKLIILDGKDEVTLGRSPDVTVCILSTMISRIHAVLKKTNTGSWTIKDNKSLNGVFVNTTKLVPQKPHELQEGDTVQFGVSTSPEVPPEFVFKYHKALKVRRNTDDKVDGPCEKRVKFDEDEVPSSGPSNERTHPIGAASPYKQPTGRHGRPDEHSPYSKYQRKMEEQEKDAQAKMADMEAKLKEMQEKLKAKESAEQQMAHMLEEEKKRSETQLKSMEDLKHKEERLKHELELKQAEMAREREALEERMREELEDQLHMKEASLLESLEAQKKALVAEKVSVEEKLKQELESEREKDKKLAEELLQQKQKLEKVIENKEAEQKLLESQLNDTRQEKDRKQEEVLRAREDILSNFADLMETELQCSICNELFVRATSLNCSHAFCSLCIAKWMKVKKECPQCRAAITTHMRSIVLDSYIEKMVEQFSDDLKNSRQELVADRKKEEAEYEKANAPQPPPAPAARGRGRGRGGRGRGRGGRGQVEAAAPELPVAPPLPPIMISDEDELDSSLIGGSDSDSESEGSVSGDDYAYYGGYGRCYTCGSRGHWANGCPFR